MKKDLHPTNYRPVVFQDDAAGFAFLTQSTAQTDDTIVWEDGNTYPLVKMIISSASHPYYTGKEAILDQEGRVDKFQQRRQAAEKLREQLANKAKKAAKAAARKADRSESRSGKTPSK